MPAINYGNNGYIGTWLCGENGVFSDPPLVEPEFSQSHTGLIPGLTITWSAALGEWALEFRVVAYHGENIIFNKTFQNDSVKTVVNGDIQAATKSPSKF